MGKKLCPDCDEPVTKDDSTCEICEEVVCEGCMDDHALEEAFPDE